MKTMRSLLVAVLLTVSTTLMADPNARTFDESLAIRQTETLVGHLDLSKRQANKILAINKNYFHRNAQLFAQCRELEKEGFMDAAAQKTIREALVIRLERKNQAIKLVLNDEQQMAYDNMLPELKGNRNNPMRFLRERWDREEPRS